MRASRRQNRWLNRGLKAISPLIKHKGRRPFKGKNIDG